MKTEIAKIVLSLSSFSSARTFQRLLCAKISRSAIWLSGFFDSCCIVEDMNIINRTRKTLITEPKNKEMTRGTCGEKESRSKNTKLDFDAGNDEKPREATEKDEESFDPQFITSMLMWTLIFARKWKSKRSIWDERRTTMETVKSTENFKLYANYSLFDRANTEAERTAENGKDEFPKKKKYKLWIIRVNSFAVSRSTFVSDLRLQV